MILSVHQPQYLPWLGYFDKIIKSDCFVFLDNVQYKNREYQNRNKIRIKDDSDGWMWLTVPVVTKGLREQLIRDTVIDNSGDWQANHFESLKFWYAKAHFFKEYLPFLEEVYLKRKWERLIDLNVHIIKFILKELDIKTPVYFESQIGTTKSGTERIIELCKKLNSDVYFSGFGGKAYLEENRFVQNDIQLRYQEFKHPVYEQCFAKNESDFIPFMSIVDLMFNAGPKSKEILQGGT